MATGAGRGHDVRIWRGQVVHRGVFCHQLSCRLVAVALLDLSASGGYVVLHRYYGREVFYQVARGKCQYRVGVNPPKMERYGHSNDAKREMCPTDSHSPMICL